MHVSAHAITRYIERVGDVSIEEALAALSTPAFQTAADFGANVVILSGGDDTVITVLPKGRRGWA